MHEVAGASRRATLALLALAGAGRPGTALAAAAAPITQPAAPGPAAFAARALALRDAAAAAGDQPYGAVVVDPQGRIVGEAPSRVVALGDPTAHAEMEAIRDAARRTGESSLSGHVLYGSARACPMCEAAAAFAGIARLVHGAGAADAGPPRLCR